MEIKILAPSFIGQEPGKCAQLWLVSNKMALTTWLIWSKILAPSFIGQDPGKRATNVLLFLKNGSKDLAILFFTSLAWSPRLLIYLGFKLQCLSAILHIKPFSRCSCKLKWKGLKLTSSPCSQPYKQSANRRRLLIRQFIPSFLSGVKWEEKGLVKIFRLYQGRG